MEIASHNEISTAPLIELMRYFIRLVIFLICIIFINVFILLFALSGSSLCILFVIIELSLIAICSLLGILFNITSFILHNVSILSLIKSSLLLCLLILVSYFLISIILRIDVSTKIHVVRNGRPLIKAIEKYHDKTMKYPDSLNDLIPDFLSVLPKTGAGEEQHFHYLKHGNMIELENHNCFGCSKYETGGYLIYAVLPNSLFSNLDILYYMPNGKYKHQHSKRIESWAYYHISYDDL